MRRRPAFGRCRCRANAEDACGYSSRNHADYLTRLAGVGKLRVNIHGKGELNTSYICVVPTCYDARHRLRPMTTTRKNTGEGDAAAPRLVPLMSHHQAQRV